MNSSAASNTIPGFRVSFLEKIIDIKGTSGQSNALKLICKMIHDTNPDLIECVEELRPLKKLVNITFKHMSEELAAIKKIQKLISKEVEFSNQYSKSELFAPLDNVFIEKLNVLHREVNEKITFLEKEHAEMKAEYEKILHYFGETNSTSITPELLIRYIVKFMDSLEAAYAQFKRNLDMQKVIFT
jgi:cytokinesis protein